MIHTRNLEQLIFGTSPTGVRELVIISGYLGIGPVRNVSNINLQTKVVSGMVPTDRIQNSLHSALTQADTQIGNLEIYYTQTIPVHSKCYVWKDDGNILCAYTGSANFSNSGLNIPNKEVLVSVETADFSSLKSYVDLILQDCVRCHSVPHHLIRQPVISPMRVRNPVQAVIGTTLRFSLLTAGRQVPSGSGINWGWGATGRSHTSPDDAYIAIRKGVIKYHPGFFTPKPPGRGNNIPLDITWDDGTPMRGLAEGNQDYARQKYPKQLSSHPEKNTMGKYLRDRMGVSHGTRVTMADFQRYGRDHVDITLTGPNSYHIDFSRPRQQHSTV